MVNIEEYILLPKLERQKHLRLEEQCIERGGNQQLSFKELLGHILNTTLPIGHKIHTCHACHNGKCCNPFHIYWGTAVENKRDAIANGYSESVWERTVAKHGLEEASRMLLELTPARKENQRRFAERAKQQPRKSRIYSYKTLPETRALQSLKKQGNKNNQFGKIWIFNKTEKISRSIKKELIQQYITAGWQIGRKIKF